MSEKQAKPPKVAMAYCASPSERALIKRAAELDDVSASKFVRRLAVAGAKKRLEAESSGGVGPAQNSKQAKSAGEFTRESLDEHGRVIHSMREHESF